MTATALGLSVIYRLIGHSNPDSVLRFLVAPLWWLAALVVGFVFKTDETLTGDAITRLVTEQPALAAAAIAVTLLAFRDADWVRKPALAATPTAYLLTVALGAGSDWEQTTALLVAGAATAVSIEMLMRGTRSEPRLPQIRPALPMLVVLPLVPRLEPHLLGAAVFGLYLVIHEIGARTHRPWRARLGANRDRGRGGSHSERWLDERGGFLDPHALGSTPSAE